MEQATEQLKP